MEEKVYSTNENGQMKIYDLANPLGAGQFGQVFKGNFMNSDVAIKFTSLEKEVDGLRQLNRAGRESILIKAAKKNLKVKEKALNVEIEILDLLKGNPLVVTLLDSSVSNFRLFVAKFYGIGQFDIRYS